jgi:oxygen-independent coproporphyrinogen-3 oxidase
MIKHPAAWAAQVDQNEEPIDGSEVLSATEIANENIMLGLRLRDGIELATLSPAGIEQANEAVTQGLLYSDLFTLGRVVLTPKGRLLADGLVSRLWN